jgi:hypothetical protein
MKSRAICSKSPFSGENGVFRSGSGELVGWKTPRPHCKLPLSKGRIKGDTVECGYHGLTSIARVNAFWAPGTGRIPSNARGVHAYPFARNAMDWSDLMGNWHWST